MNPIITCIEKEIINIRANKIFNKSYIHGYEDGLQAVLNKIKELGPL